MPMEDTQFKPGQSGNPSGRPKNTMKDFMRKRFMKMSDEAKEEFLKGVPLVDQIKLAEGNPHQTSDNQHEITIPKPIYDGLSRHNSNKKDIQPDQKD